MEVKSVLKGTDKHTAQLPVVGRQQSNWPVADTHIHAHPVHPTQHEHTDVGHQTSASLLPPIFILITTPIIMWITAILLCSLDMAGDVLALEKV